MQVIRNGKFSLPITSETLSKGLRKSANNLVNNQSLIICNGVIGKEGVLKRIQELVKSFEISTSFPFPQIFVETNLIIVCTLTHIYEYGQGDLILKYSVSGGSTWSLISSHDFIYMSNGVVAITRDPISKVWSESSELPTAMAICNYNGQVIIGAPNAGYNLGD